ncbi:uncharacterized protein CELE_W04B5.9 [Caenorhabditis elegans]|uniref:Uncharacterized protein n=1 Tax=Caenorhabditis elegans TaxID=6239 RepID=A0A8S4QAX6_CAEEL|nr:Uncharacterized protein CELE_W04B5.9 [Caenorhabditis elegans]CAH2175806.1 Uncharacterized protein CELE_W04B5.9 [Caenorhabditis elegans]
MLLMVNELLSSHSDLLGQTRKFAVFGIEKFLEFFMSNHQHQHHSS